ncbi:MAG: NAD(P)-binding domain-containing protein [Chloroflexota bacterium]
MTVIYHDEHADPAYLIDKQIAVIGYGKFGRPVALNLRDSGVKLMIGALNDASGQTAVSDGLNVGTIAEAVQQSDILMMLLPEEIMPAIYLEQISPHLRRGQTLIFSSAYTVMFRFIEPPPFVDVGLIAPRIPGAVLHELHESGEGFQSFVAVGQDASGQSWTTILAVAQAVGALRQGGIEVSFEQETELDLFVHQAILPAIHNLLTTAATLLLSRGYPPEAVFTELYLSGELGFYLKQASQFGLLNTLNLAPRINQYGTTSRIDRFNELKLQRLMEDALKEIHSGDFAREWTKEANDNYRRLRSFLKLQENLELWEFEKQTLELLGRDVDTNTD